MAQVHVITHPLVQHKLTIMRDRTTPTAEFRRLTREVAMLLCYEVTRDLELTTVGIETPLCPMQAPTLAGKKLVFAPILRAGVGLLEGMLDLVPAARVAHIGLYRDLGHRSRGPAEGGGLARPAHGLFVGRARRHRSVHEPPPGRGRLCGGRGQPSRRERLYRPGPRRRRRPHVRDALRPRRALKAARQLGMRREGPDPASFWTPPALTSSSTSRRRC